MIPEIVTSCSTHNISHIHSKSKVSKRKKEKLCLLYDMKVDNFKEQLKNYERDEILVHNMIND